MTTFLAYSKVGVITRAAITSTPTFRKTTLSNSLILADSSAPLVHSIPLDEMKRKWDKQKCKSSWVENQTVYYIKLHAQAKQTKEFIYCSYSGNYRLITQTGFLGRQTPSLWTPSPFLLSCSLLLSMMLYGMGYPFIQSGSAVTAMTIPAPGEPQVLAGRAEREAETTLTLCKHCSVTKEVCMLSLFLIKNMASYKPL